MPFKSEDQRKWMHANKPEMAERWEEHTPKGKKLPKRVSKKGKKMNKKSAVVSLLLMKAGIRPTEKAAFVADFCHNVYKSLKVQGIDKEAFAQTNLARDLVKLAARKPAMDKIIDMIGLGTPKGQLFTGMSILGPISAGGLGGAATAHLTSPSETAISNIQKEEVLARYNSAVDEAKGRIAARRARAAV